MWGNRLLANRSTPASDFTPTAWDPVRSNCREMERRRSSTSHRYIISCYRPKQLHTGSFRLQEVSSKSCLALWTLGMNRPGLLRHALRKVFPHFCKDGFPTCRAADSPWQVNRHGPERPIPPVRHMGIDIPHPGNHPVAKTGTRCTT